MPSPDLQYNWEFGLFTTIFLIALILLVAIVFFNWYSMWQRKRMLSRAFKGYEGEIKCIKTFVAVLDYDAMKQEINLIRELLKNHGINHHIQEARGESSGTIWNLFVKASDSERTLILLKEKTNINK